MNFCFATQRDRNIGDSVELFAHLKCVGGLLYDVGGLLQGGGRLVLALGRYHLQRTVAIILPSWRSSKTFKHRNFREKHINCVLSFPIGTFLKGINADSQLRIRGISMNSMCGSILDDMIVTVAYSV